MYICSLVCIPYVLIYLIRQLVFISHFDAVAFTSFLLSVTALCLVIGESFYESGRPDGEKKGLTFFLFISGYYVFTYAMDRNCVFGNFDL